jgi:hypothetical protein
MLEAQWKRELENTPTEKKYLVNEHYICMAISSLLRAGHYVHIGEDGGLWGQYNVCVGGYTKYGNNLTDILVQLADMYGW